MTGIVGPNGCGKSNLVEALRWVMGENSPKRMRGSEMDDVIFAGTAMRPSRNLAEATLILDNTRRTTIAEFNDSDEIVVTRRIERGGGSEYRINGKPVRQRDVHVLFADHATGAHSTSIVGQGQIDALIRAKPQDRRQILEEASGTSGLHARRHEAELKLKAAEQNVTRVDDVLRTLDAQLRSLKQQVRQASRYRNLAEGIRKTEAALLHLRWLEAESNDVKAREALGSAERHANDLLAVVTRGNALRTEIAAELPALRQGEAAAAAIVQKLALNRENLESERERLESLIASEKLRLEQTRQDYERETSRLSDSEAAVAKLLAEDQALLSKAQDMASALPDITEVLAATKARVAEMDSTLNDFLKQVTSAEVVEKNLQQEIEALAKRRSELTQRRAALDEQRMALAEEIAARPDLSMAKALVEACEKELAKRQDQAEAAEKARRDAEAALQAQRERAQDSLSRETKLKAEAEAITAMFSQHDDDVEQIIDLITVAPGFENALAVALGDALTAALDTKAAQHWRELPPLDVCTALPEGAMPISGHIHAPKALERSLSQIGLVRDQDQGEALAGLLAPGQTLVSPDGWAWRWDGFTVTPQAQATTAVRLQQRNRLAALMDDIAVAEAEARKAEASQQEAATIFQNCQDLDTETRASLQKAFKALHEARDHLSKQERDSAATDARLNAIGESLRQITTDIAQIGARADLVEEERAALPDIEKMREDIVAKRLELAEERNAFSRQQSECDRLKREQEICDQRRHAIAQEKTEWQDRADKAQSQSRTLAERMATLEKELADLEAKPGRIAQALGALLDELSEAESKRKKAADALIAAEQRLSVAEHQLKNDENALAAAREERVRAEGAIQAGHESQAALKERIAEKVGCAPEDLKKVAGFGDDADWPNMFELEQTLARYLRERDNMGPVNLRADVEAEAVQADIQKLQSEKDDLVAAIGKLRQGISQLNREARERLQNAFSTVNERFQVLFKRLFGGGGAHLELIDNEDPLNAGLEIYACPPGKKQQVLSLLSGGERTLTALALLFAVFQTNPSPICVLDEAEAALDESNIDRFCALIKDIAKETGTRFLIVTHQRLTMANMDRLYGVTMSERGVSQLVSVDLDMAMALRDQEGNDAIASAEFALANVQAA